MTLLRQKVDNAKRAAESLSTAAQQLEILTINSERRDVREGFQSIGTRSDELARSAYSLEKLLREIRAEAVHQSIGKLSGQDGHD